MKVLHYNNTAQSFKAFKLKALNEKPDIVHIHVCWSWTAWRVMLWCRNHLKPVVISPGKQLMPWNVLRNYWLCKMPKLLIFQRWMIKNAHAIVAVTEQEQQHLLKIGIYPLLEYNDTWNDRVVLIPDARYTNKISEEDMNLLYLKLYQKVLDSHSFMVMSKDDKLAENTLLRLGLSQDPESQGISLEDAERVRSLSEDSWRKILLHADEEGVLQEIRQGASLLQIAPQTIAGIDRFPARSKKNNHPLPEDKAQLKPFLLKEYSEEKHAGDADVRVCTVILNFIHEMQKGTLSRRHVADLYSTLRFTDYNERKVTDVLQLLKERKTLARILQILHESLGLEEGFMPMEAKNDRGTRKIKKLLYKANIQ
ncbi:MAG: glycosyltransferase [Prevotella sp.]|nr:glycosyltransferase [Prevotella sp.]